MPLYNLHPLRNLPVGTDPGVLTSNGMSVTGGAEVTLAVDGNGDPVPAWSPLLNGGAGGFDPELQAVRVYIPAGGESTDGHRLDLATDCPNGLTHIWTDDPGSVGKQVRFAGRSKSGLDPVTGVVTLSDTPQPVSAANVPVDGSGIYWDVRRVIGNLLETNLLYSASQVAPHSIERYNDERSQGWALRDENNPHLGAESLTRPTPIETYLTLSAPERFLSLKGPTVTDGS